jgi:hypothetical protein
VYQHDNINKFTRCFHKQNYYIINVSSQVVQVNQFSRVCTLHIAKENVTVPQLWIKPKVGGREGGESASFEASISLIFKILNMIEVN